MFTDTDSLCYGIKTEAAYKDLYEKKKKIKRILILLIIQKKSKYYSEENKKVIGKMKDETAGAPNKGFVGLRSKMYSYFLDDKCIKNVKVL